MKSVYMGIALFGLVCALCSLAAYGDPVVKSETGPDFSCVFLNNLSLFANACAVYSPHPIPSPQGSPPSHAGPPDQSNAPDHASGPETADCIVCHTTSELVSRNLSSFASADAMYNPHPGPRPHDPPPSVSSCINCHVMGQEPSVRLLGTQLVTRNYGGGMYNYNSSPVLINCTFSANAAGHGGGIYNDDSSTPTVTNCILWGNTANEIEGEPATVTYSCVEGGYDGLGDEVGNISDDPFFVDAAIGNLRLNSNSPCINTGTAIGAPVDDIRGVPRPQGLGIDMGVYEYYDFAISQQPLSQTVPEGNPAMFTIGVSGGLGTVMYQWQWDGVDIENENGSVYTIDPVDLGNEGSYTCLVADDYDELVSDTAILTVISPVLPIAGLGGVAAAVLAAGLLVVLRRGRK